MINLITTEQATADIPATEPATTPPATPPALAAVLFTALPYAPAPPDCMIQPATVGIVKYPIMPIIRNTIYTPFEPSDKWIPIMLYRFSALIPVFSIIR